MGPDDSSLRRRAWPGDGAFLSSQESWYLKKRKGKKEGWCLQKAEAFREVEHGAGKVDRTSPPVTPTLDLTRMTVHG